jgi:protease-4
MKKACIILGIVVLVIIAAGAIVAILSRVELGEKVAVITVEGTIMDSQEVVQDIKDYVGNPSVKAIVLRVESPGGAVAPSQEIYEEIKKATQKKKVVVSMGALAASGGYYISAPASRIFANPGTITGSIGVIMELPDFGGLMQKLGIKAQVVKAGEHKDLAPIFREMRPEEREIIQNVLNDVHEQFIKAVSDGRKIPIEKVREIADGRIFSGQQALGVGLVDELGDLEDAIHAASKLSGIKGEPTIVRKKKRGGILDLLTGKAKFNFPQAAPGISFKYIFSIGGRGS